MAALSGILGGVKYGSDVGGIEEWGIDERSARSTAIVTSGSQGGTIRLPGNKDWRGHYNAVGHTPIILPGYTGTFLGAFETGTSKKGVTGTIIGLEATIRWDIETPDVIKHSVSFAGNSALDYTTAVTVAGGTDTVVSCIGGASVDKFSIAPATTGVYAEMTTDVRSISLTLRAADIPYASSGTFGLVKRFAGPIDAEVSASVYCDDLALLPDEGDVVFVKIFTDNAGSTFWEIKAMVVESIGDIVTSRSGAIIGATVNFSFSGYYTAAGSVWTAGYIKTPAVATYWPV
jgi:hypothetical protein